MQRASFLHDRATPWETPTVQNRKLKATFGELLGSYLLLKLYLSVLSKKRLLSMFTNRLVRSYLQCLRVIRIVFLRNFPIYNCNNNYKCVKRLFKIRSNCQAVANFGFSTYRNFEQRRLRRACADSPEPSLLAHTKFGCR